jgi:hypothetical protein
MRVEEVPTTTRMLAAVVIVVVGIIAAIAITSLIRARMSDREALMLRADNELVAITSLRAIGAAEAQYRERCAGYAPSLNELIRTHYLPPAKFTAGSTIATNGYKISVEAEGTVIPATNPLAGCVGSVTDFFSHADPIVPGSTGTRYYASDSRQIMFQDSVPMTYPPRGRQSQVAR